MVEVLSISSSKLKTYMECPALYYWRYVAKRPEKPAEAKAGSVGQPTEVVSDTEQDVRIEQEPSVIFDSGRLVHRVLELAGKKRTTNRNCDKKVTKKELLTLLESVATEPSINDWHRPPIISPETIESAAKVLALCWKSIHFHFTIETETKFNVPVGPVEDENGNVVVKELVLNGIIDRVDRLPNRHIKIVDYKSGWSVMSRAEAELDPQINFYLVVGKLMYPNDEIDMELRYLNRGIRLGPIHYTGARKDWLLNAYLKPTVARMVTWGKYHETPGAPQCYSCPRKSECVSFASMVKGSLGPVGADMGQNLALYERLGEIEGNIKLLKEQIKPFVNAAVEKADDGEIFAGQHRARVIFRNSTAYHDLRNTAMVTAKAIIDTKKALAEQKTAEQGVALPQAPEIPSDPDALRAYAEKLAAENAKLKSLATESATAFEVACKIAKAQAGLVNEFVDGLPEDVTLPVAQAIETTSTNAGYYSLEVERIAIPFQDRMPSSGEIAEATRQEKTRKKLPKGAKPILDDSHEKVIQVDAVVVESTSGALQESESTEAPKALAVDTKTLSADTMASAASAAPAEQFDLFGGAPASPGVQSVSPVNQGVEEAKPGPASPASKPAWAQPDCKACEGRGVSSRGGPCSPCFTKAQQTPSMAAT